jgi:fibro-slime domain-containing protein
MITATPVEPFVPMTEPLPPTLTLTGIIRDFTPDHPDFERDPDVSGGYGLDQGIVAARLGPDRKPVFAGQPRSRNWTTTKENFDQWYRLDLPNRSKVYSLTLTRNPGSNVYTFDSNTDPLFQARGGFFPIDNELAGNTPGYQHNYHFTYELHYEFTYQPGQVFKFRGDDDLWVFINHQLVIDLGGVHGALPAEVNLDTLGLTPGQTYPFDLFYAERHTTEANFRVETSIVFPPMAQIVATVPQAQKVGPVHGEFTITLDRPASQALTVPYTIAGTAIAGVDYQPLSGNVTFAPGVVSQKIPVLPLGMPPAGNSSATVIVTLQPGQGYSLSADRATVTIADQVIVEKAVASIITTRPEAWRPRPGNPATELGEFSMRLVKPLATAVTIGYQVTGTAMAGLDYQALAGSVTIPAGQSAVAIPVVALAASGLRADRLTVIATLTTSTAYDLGVNTATVQVRGPRPRSGPGPQG